MLNFSEFSVRGFRVVRGSINRPMKLEYQSRWLRLVIELLPRLPEIRRFRVATVRLEGQTGRLLQRRIANQMRRPTPEATA